MPFLWCHNKPPLMDEEAVVARARSLAGNGCIDGESGVLEIKNGSERLIEELHSVLAAFRPVLLFAQSPSG